MATTSNDYAYRFDEVSFGIAVRELREKLGITQKALGQMIGVSGSHLSSIETAENGASLTLKTFLSLCVMIDLAPAYFFTMERV